MADYLNGIVYLSTENYATLKANGTLTVNGTTYTYDKNTLYITDDDGSDTGSSGSTGGTFNGGIVNNKMYYQAEVYPYVPVADLTSGFLYHTKNGSTLTPKQLTLSDISDADDLLTSDRICELSLGVYTGIFEGSTDAQIGTNAGYSWVDYNPTSNNSAISVEVAGADAVKTLANAYKALTNNMKYVHNVKVSAGGSSGSCEFYFTVYNTSSTALTISNLVSTYTISNKLSGISGYVTTTSGTTPVYNVFFESSSVAHFNGSSVSCTGSTLTVTDTIVGRVVST